jgi:ATP-dependent protease ClpP protease subunit
MTIKATWYSIRKKTAMAAAVVGALAATEILIYGDIGMSWWDETVTAAAFVKEVQAIDSDKITVRINSIGGSVPDGLAIYNAIKRHPAEVTVEIDGMAFSVASLIAMAGDKVHMAANAMLMVHAPWTYVDGIAGNAVEVREHALRLEALAKQLDGWASAMSTSYAAKTGRQADMQALLADGQDHYYTAEEALAGKFIDGISDEVPVTAMASAAQLVGARFRDAPAAWLQACGVKPAAAPAASPAASAAQPQDSDMKIKRFTSLWAAAVLMNAAGAHGSDTSGTGTTPAAGGAAATEPTAAQRTAILAAERTRQDAIEAQAKPFLALAGVSELLARFKADPMITADTAGLQILAAVGKNATPAGGATNGVCTVEDERDKRISAAATAIMARAGLRGTDGKHVVADGSNPFRGRRLVAIAEACLASAGVKTQGMDQMAIVGMAFTQSTSDFPLLLENVLHKSLQASYALQEDTWSKFCRIGTVSDFRAHPRYRVGSIGNLQPRLENGEYKYVQIPDGEKSTITAATKGLLINISREMIINDDLGAFTGLTSSMGRAAKRTIEADVYVSLLSNGGFGPLLADGVTLFHASHNNVGAGAPGVATFEAGRVVMRAQKDVGGNDFLELSPEIWLGPDSMVGAAKVTVNSTYDPDAANKLQRANIAAGLVKTIVGTPRLTGLPWFFFANAEAAPCLEVAFLDGKMEPYLEWQNGFTVDGMVGKVRHDYGVGGIDYRGGYRSTGA